MTVGVLRVGLLCVSVVFPYHAQLLVAKLSGENYHRVTFYKNI